MGFLLRFKYDKDDLGIREETMRNINMYKIENINNEMMNNDIDSKL